MKVTAAHTRTFNKYGSEVVPDDLNKDAATKLDLDKLMGVVGGGAAVPKTLGLGADVTQLLHPTVSGCFLFWIDTDQTKNAGYKDGEEVLLRTMGDSIFLAKMSRTDLTAFEGMEHGKLLSQISSRTDHHADGDKVLPGDDKEGVAEDEWD